MFFLWNLQTFSWQLFWRTSVNVCFWTLFKKRLELRCFPLTFLNYSRTPILQCIHKRLDLKHQWGSLSLINFTSVTPWKLLTLLERDCRRGIFLWILKQILGKLFRRTPRSNHFSHDIFFSFCQISEVCSLKSIRLVEQW